MATKSAKTVKASATKSAAKAPVKASVKTAAVKNVAVAVKNHAKKIITVSVKAKDAKPVKPKQPFFAGESVVYPAHGVGQVLAISRDTFAGRDMDFIIVNFACDRMTLKIPMDKAVAAGLRKVSSDNVMKSALATLRTKSRIRRTMWSRRAQEYTQKINSGDPVSIAEVVRDLHRSGGRQADQSFSERQIYEQALSRLVGELAACERITQPDATAKLNRILANS